MHVTNYRHFFTIARYLSWLDGKVKQISDSVYIALPICFGFVIYAINYLTLEK